MRTLSRTLLTLALVIPASHALAWREAGHFAVCEIAHRHLTPAARSALTELLGGKDFASQCTWPDMVRKSPALKHTYDWHFINLEDTQRYFDPATVNPKCDVLRALHGAQTLLADRRETPTKRLHALRFLGHFVGDIHQPLHVGRKSDLGGNNVKVSWFNEPTYTSVEILVTPLNAAGLCADDGRYVDEATGECVKRTETEEQATLHKTWDLLMVKKLIETERLIPEDDDSEYTHLALATYIDQGVRDADALLWQRSTPLDWAEESKSYRLEPYTSIGADLAVVYPLDAVYYNGQIPRLKQRLAMAGHRLAGVLNRAFDAPVDTPLRAAFLDLRASETLERIYQVLTRANLARPGSTLNESVACPGPTPPG